MLRKSLTAIVLAGVLFAPTPALGQKPIDPTPATCDERTPAFHVERAKRIIALAYSKRRWEDPSPATRKQVRKWKDHRSCLEHRADRKVIGNYRARKQAAFEKFRRWRVALTPYRGPGGTRWAIPYYIVACESHGSWSASNPSGAVGPYQLLGWGAPFPVHGERDRLAHHRIAARLWAGGSGASHWVCA